MKVSLVISGILIVTSVFIILSSFSDNNKSNNAHVSNIIAHTPYIPDKLTFCGEKVPLEYFDVFESFEKEMLINAYWHSQTILFLKKVDRYFPVLEPILNANNVPDDFKYLVLAESGFSDIVSPAGAAGFWHFLESTARDYGLEVNDEVDERYNLEKSTYAACKYFRESYELYKSWTMVAASYNAGRKGIDRQIDRQGEHDYYNLLFAEETSRYVFRILALKTILENPEDYGFILEDHEIYKPIPYKQITINDSIADIGIFARENETNYKLLKFLNPWLRDTKLTNPQRKEYIIKLPLSTSREL
jgi:membrane-bound lytic murein transglycosylase D